MLAQDVPVFYWTPAFVVFIYRAQACAKEIVMDEDYSLPVHTSLMEKKQLLGIGPSAFYTILFITTILTALVSFYCIGIGIVAVLICRRLCKKEPMLIEFLFENLMQQDIYEG